MCGFREIKASKSTLARRKLILGCGINDADYITQPMVGGKQLFCPYYAKWYSMLSRCYSKKYHNKFPTYIECSVINDWLTFSNFKDWMEKQGWENKHLDKDLLCQGNKVYGPDTCLFVEKEINLLLHDHKAKRGACRQGVHFSTRDKKFIAQISIYCKRTHLGCFNTEDEAYSAYKLAKYAHIKEVALEHTEPLRSALLKYTIDFNRKDVSNEGINSVEQSKLLQKYRNKQ